MKNFRHADKLYISAMVSVALFVSGCNSDSENLVSTGEEAGVDYARTIAVGDNIDTSSWSLKWADEFSDDALDTSVWTPMIGRGAAINGGDGWGNGELQWYTSDDENLRVRDGFLYIIARNEGAPDNDTARPYTSARIESQQAIDGDPGTMKYGRVDIRAKLPEGQGMWPALWMLGNDFGTVNWPFVGEIDMMESAGSIDTISGNYYYANGANATTSAVGEATFPDIDFRTLNVFSIVWTDKLISWYVNGDLFMSRDITGEDQTEFRDRFFYFLMNVAVGGAYPGDPDDTTPFPQTLKVDYIRVYEAL